MALSMTVWAPKWVGECVGPKLWVCGTYTVGVWTHTVGVCSSRCPSSMCIMMYMCPVLPHFWWESFRARPSLTSVMVNWSMFTQDANLYTIESIYVHIFSKTI